MNGLSATSSEGRVFVLETDEALLAAIQSALREVAPNATVDVARSITEAQHLISEAKPDLFVLDMDATQDFGQEFLLDLRTSHPEARAIILTAVHLAAQREQAAGIGAITFLEKPFPHSDFTDLVQALLRPSTSTQAERFQGTLSDLHLADIIQLKCMSGSTAALEFTGAGGEKARVYFENGQVRHAVAPGQEGIAAFNEIVNWKGGKISEVSGAGSPRTIDVDWQVLLMEAVRKYDETSASRQPKAPSAKRHTILVIDDSLMLLSFVKEILIEANFDVLTAATAEEGLTSANEHGPDLILLDYILPDLKGDEVSRRLLAEEVTASIPILYMSGFGTDLRSDSSQTPNVIGALNKPFTSDMLIKTVQEHLSNQEGEEAVEQPVETITETSVGDGGEFSAVAPEEPAPAAEVAAAAGDAAWWNNTPAPEATSEPTADAGNFYQPQEYAPAPEQSAAPADDSLAAMTSSYFCGDTNFFSLTWALRTIAKEKLTGVLRCFWNQQQPVELYARDGKLTLVTTRDPEVYCAEAPITLVNVDQERIAAARMQQTQSGSPLFITLEQEQLILREPAVQLIQHYGQKLFAQLWTAPRVRFMFEQSSLPPFADGIDAEEDVDHWVLSTLRFIQFQELGERSNYDVTLIPAYTRDGFERVQHLRLTVAEAQFASQFNGVRPIAQIAKNLRLDLKFARLTLFRFLAMEIIELWPPATGDKPEKKGMFQRFGKSIGFGD